MRVLVTGGAGYVGSVLASQLLRDGHTVCVLDSLLYGGESLLGLYPQDGFAFLRGDIRDRAALCCGLAGADAVVHLAAIVGDPACKRQPDLARAVNLDASRLLYEESRRAGVARFIFISTCSNYGSMNDQTQILNEETKLQPHSLYAETKVAVEQDLLASPGGPAVTVLRFATLFGVSPRMRFDLTVNEFTLALLTKGTLELYGAQSWRPYLHVRDAASAIRLILAQPLQKVDGRVFNVGDTKENYTKEQIVSLICQQIGGNCQIYTTAAQEDPRNYRVAFERIQQELGFHITRTVVDGINEVSALIRMGLLVDLNHPRYRN